MERIGSQLVFFLSLFVVLLTFQNCNKAFTPSNINRIQQSSLKSTREEAIRILPLGDSLTLGTGSSSCLNADGCSGYRLPLYQELKSEGVNFTFVGSQSSGSSELPEKNHEGHSGSRIDQIAVNIVASLQLAKPDIILLHIGSNDVAQKFDLAAAPIRLKELIETILSVSPNTHIVVALLLPVQGNVQGYDTLIKNYNQAIEPMLLQKQGAGKKVYVVDMHSAVDASFGSADYALDPAHLSDIGYAKMASRWKNALFDNAIVVHHSE